MLFELFGKNIGKRGGLHSFWDALNLSVELQFSLQTQIAHFN